MLARGTNANGSPMRGCSADSCERVKSAPTSDFCKGVWGADACAEYECERLTDGRIFAKTCVWQDACARMRTTRRRADFAKACVTRMLARSTNANGAPTSDFCEGVCDADACAEYECEGCAEYECERRADERMLRWLMRTREGRADVWIFAKACRARMLAWSTNANDPPMNGYCADSCERVNDAPMSGFLRRRVGRGCLRGVRMRRMRGYCADG